MPLSGLFSSQYILVVYESFGSVVFPRGSGCSGTGSGEEEMATCKWTKVCGCGFEKNRVEKKGMKGNKSMVSACLFMSEEKVSGGR